MQGQAAEHKYRGNKQLKTTCQHLSLFLVVLGQDPVLLPSVVISLFLTQRDNNSSVLKPNVLHLPRVTLFACFSLLPFFFFIEELYCSCHSFSLFLPSPCQVLIQLSIFIRVRLLMLFERNGPITLLTTSVLHVFYVSLAGISGTKSVFGLSSSFHL